MAAVEMPPQTRDAAVENGQGQPDTRALAVAQALQDHLPDTHQVILFGSRATGVWKPRSDIDLAVLGASSDMQTICTLGEQARKEAEVVYSSSPPIQITPLPWMEFEEFRTSFPHVAGQVQLLGLTTEGEHLPPMPQDNPWPGVQSLLQASQRHLEVALSHVGNNRLHFALFHALSAMEMAVKATLGAHTIRFDHHHALNEFVTALPQDLQTWLDSKITSAQRDALVKFRNPSLYGGVDLVWPPDPPEAIIVAAQQVCGRLADHILEHLDKTPDDVKYAHWLKDEPFGGVESIPLPPPPYLSEADQVTIGVLRTFLDGLVPSDDLEQIANTWQENGPPPDALIRIRNVQTNPSEWRSWLSLSATDSDSDTLPPR
ncbi:MAG: HEPN domain-containing protein [Caldilineaceae bacterium]|nr:HEPN domain-containing protein [Caldilineaceae bacterium]